MTDLALVRQTVMDVRRAREILTTVEDKAKAAGWSDAEHWARTLAGDTAWAFLDTALHHVLRAREIAERTHDDLATHDARDTATR